MVFEQLAYTDYCLSFPRSFSTVGMGQTCCLQQSNLHISHQMSPHPDCDKQLSDTRRGVTCLSRSVGTFGWSGTQTSDVAVCNTYFTRILFVIVYDLD